MIHKLVFAMYEITESDWKALDFVLLPPETGNSNRGVLLGNDVDSYARNTPAEVI